LGVILREYSASSSAAGEAHVHLQTARRGGSAGRDPSAQAQAVMQEPAYCAQFYPGANCQYKGPGNPCTDPNYRRYGAKFAIQRMPK
jgi:hypothetical protein